MWHENRLPPVVTVACLAFICLIALIRAALVRVRSIDRRVNEVALLTAVTVMLREPAVAERIAPVIPGGALVIFDLWHFTLILLVVLIQALFLEILKGSDQARRRVCIAIAAGYGVAFLALSHPGRTRGLLVQDAFGWQYPAYFGIYCAAIIGSSLFALCVSLPLWRQAKSLQEKVVYVVLILSAIVTLLNMTLFYSGVLVAASGSDSGFARETEVRASGELMLPNMALIMLLLVPSCVRAIVGLLRLSKEDRELRSLRAVWQDLTAAVPEVVLELSAEDRAGATVAERLHGMRVEVQDAIAVLSSVGAAWPDGPTSERIAELADGDPDIVEATQLLIAAKTVVRNHLYSRSETRGPQEFDLSILARSWPTAQRLAARLDQARDSAAPSPAT